MGKQIQVSVFSDEIGAVICVAAREWAQIPSFCPKMGKIGAQMGSL
jgi:hypothetical protein